MSETSHWNGRLHPTDTPCAGCFGIIMPSELVWCELGGKSYCTRCASDRGSAKAKAQLKVDEASTLKNAVHSFLQIFLKK